jgi:hypothetical protein
MTLQYESINFQWLLSFRHVTFGAASLKVPGPRPEDVTEFFLIYLIFPTALDTGIYSASNRSEYQTYYHEGEEPVLKADKVTAICEPTVEKVLNI